MSCTADPLALELATSSEYMYCGSGPAHVPGRGVLVLWDSFPNGVKLRVTNY